MPVLPVAMPKIIPKYSVTVRNDTNLAKPLYEHITPSKDIRLKYANLCKPRRYFKPKTERPKSTPLTDNERRQLMEEWVEEVAVKAVLSKLVLEKRKLERKSLLDRIERPPLELRLSTPAPEDFEQPSLKGMHIPKKKYLERLKEVCPVFDAVKTRLEPIQLKLNEEDKRENLGLTTKTTSELRDRLWDLLNDLEDCYKDYKERGRRWTHAKWRKLLGALKKFRRVSFENLEERFEEICKELVALDVTFHDL